MRIQFCLCWFGVVDRFIGWNNKSGRCCKNLGSIIGNRGDNGLLEVLHLGDGEWSCFVIFRELRSLS
ncbi:hypothetical protein [Candidatus Hodgkinia cicadicola]|uniref:hypothetical protein n=1 Tax=Candidatus Hodgkinia cicadicola TaxID=573658 RepID=UPI0011BAAF07